jgi:hypothetical protein
MAGLGKKTFAVEEILASADVNGYLMDQSVMRFANSTVRGTAIGTAVSEGMVSYLDDSNAIEVYNGAAWVGLESSLNDGTAGFTALSNGTAGISYQPVSHNYIINGAMDNWQRGTSVTVSGGFQYGPDRWRSFPYAASSSTLNQVTFTPAELNAIGFGDARFYLRHRSTSVQSLISHPIEDVRTLAGQTVAISFWAKASSNLSLTARLDQNFGGGGSAGATSSSVTSSVTTSWQRFTGTTTVPSMAGKTIGTNSYLELIFFSGTINQDIDLWGVQLEAGSIATPFKRHAPSLQGELAACQRYFFTNYPSGFAPGADLGAASLDFASLALSAKVPVGGTTGSSRGRSQLFNCPVEMRAAPTMTFFDFVGNLNRYSAGNADGSRIGDNVSPDAFGGTIAYSKHVTFQTVADDSGHAYAGVMFSASSEL